MALAARDTSSEYSLSSMSAQSTGEECFRSPCHAESSMARMESYLQHNQLTDVTLIAGRFFVLLFFGSFQNQLFYFLKKNLLITGNKRIPAHRLILCAGSEYFAAMFTSGLRETNQSEVELQFVDGNALSALVQYCYTGILQFTFDYLS